MMRPSSKVVIACPRQSSQSIALGDIATSTTPKPKPSAIDKVSIAKTSLSDPEILNTIHWTQALDATFKENAKRFPDVYWQSFGSQEGVLRVYPASQWRTVDDLPDLYDVRRRPWYIHGTSSPKDVVVLLDT